MADYKPGLELYPWSNCKSRLSCYDLWQSIMGQIGKRIFLLVTVNILVMVTITLILGLLHVGQYFPQGGLAGLAVVCLVWGFTGAFISLGLSRLMAKWMMGVQVIPPETGDPELRQLV